MPVPVDSCGKPWLLPCDFDMRIRHGRLVTYQVPRTARWDVERNTAGIFIFSRCPLSSEFCLSIHSLSLSPVPVVGSLPGQFLCIASHRLLQSHSLALCLPRQPPANSCLASTSSPPPPLACNCTGEYADPSPCPCPCLCPSTRSPSPSASVPLSDATTCTASRAPWHLPHHPPTTAARPSSRVRASTLPCTPPSQTSP